MNMREVVADIVRLHESILERLIGEHAEQIRIIGRQRLQSFLDEYAALNDNNDITVTAVDYENELRKVHCMFSMWDRNCLTIEVLQRNQTPDSTSVYDSFIASSPITKYIGLDDGDCVVVKTKFSESTIHLSIFTADLVDYNVVHTVRAHPYVLWNTAQKIVNRKKK